MRVPSTTSPPGGTLRARIRLTVSSTSLEDRRHRTINTRPAIAVETVKTTITRNFLMDGGGLSSKDAKKLAAIDMKKIARFKNVEDTPPLSSRRSSSSDTK